MAHLIQQNQNTEEAASTSVIRSELTDEALGTLNRKIY